MRSTWAQVPGRAPPPSWSLLPDTRAQVRVLPMIPRLRPCTSARVTARGTERAVHASSALTVSDCACGRRRSGVRIEPLCQTRCAVR